MERTSIDLWVGAFVAVGFAALLILAFKVGNIGGEGQRDAYKVEARFDNIGGLHQPEAELDAGLADVWTQERLGKLWPKTESGKFIPVDEVTDFAFAA